MSLVLILGWLFTLLGLCGAAYTLLAAFLVGRFARRPERAAQGFPPISVLKPLHGAEPGLAANLESFFQQDYPAPFQMVMGVHDPRDEAVKIVQQLRGHYVTVDAALVADAQRHGANPKISNLINMAPAAEHDILVLSDSDIGVKRDYLRKLVAALIPGDVGAVTCVYTGVAVGGLGSRLSAMGINYQFLPNVVTGVSLGLAHPCFGSTIAIKRAVLAEIGGFKAFASHLADDNQIGRAVRATGRRVAIPGFAVRHTCTEGTLRAWFAHELRWMRTIRTVDSAGHYGSVITHAFPLALVGAILSGFSQVTLAVLLATILARAVLKDRIDNSFGGQAAPHWLLPLRDVLSFGVFLASLFGASVVWQDARLHVHHDGGMSIR